MKVNWDDENPNMWENKTYSKPPTSYVYVSISYEGSFEYASSKQLNIFSQICLIFMDLEI